MFYSSFSAIRKILLAVATIPFITARAQLSTDELVANMPTAPAAPGYNVEGGTVFDNFVGLYNSGQLFFLATHTTVNEKPATEPVAHAVLFWCGNLAFSDFMTNNGSSYIGYAGRCAGMFLAGYAELLAAGNQFPFDASKLEFAVALGISAVFVEQLNLFEGTLHVNSDDVTGRWWDDGRKRMPQIVWEGNDEGNTNPNAATSAWTACSEITWVSTEEAAALLNKTKVDLTPEAFVKVYANAWIKSHKEEAATDNPYPDAELEIVAEVENSTETGGDSNSDATGDGDSDAAGATDSSTNAGATRKLASATTRVVSAALRLFGV